MRHTHAMIQVAAALLDEPLERHWGYGLSRQAGVRSGVMYPILHRMLDEGWLTDGWDESNASRRHPPRRYYELTDVGLRELGAILDEARVDPRFAAFLRPAQA
jgi:PadR family transcriptional regulator PadR